MGVIEGGRWTTVCYRQQNMAARVYGCTYIHKSISGQCMLLLHAMLQESHLARASSPSRLSLQGRRLALFIDHDDSDSIHRITRLAGNSRNKSTDESTISCIHALPSLPHIILPPLDVNSHHNGNRPRSPRLVQAAAIQAQGQRALLDHLCMAPSSQALQRHALHPGLCWLLP